MAGQWFVLLLAVGSIGRVVAVMWPDIRPGGRRRGR